MATFDISEAGNAVRITKDGNVDEVQKGYYQIDDPSTDNILRIGREGKEQFTIDTDNDTITVNEAPFVGNSDDLRNAINSFFFKASSGGGGGAVDSVTGDGVDNTDPSNPVISYPTPSDIGALDKSGDTMSGNLDMGTNNIINGGSIAITGNYTGTDYNGVPLTSLGDGSLSLNDDGTYSQKIGVAQDSRLYTVTDTGLDLLKPAAESWAIANVEGNSNLNVGVFWGVAVLYPPGTYNQMAFQLNNFAPSLGQSWQARAAIYDPLTGDLVTQDVFQIDDTLVGDFPNIVLTTPFTLTRARYMYAVLGVNDNVGGGSLQAKRTTANSLNNALVSFSFNQASGALPATLPALNAENNQWYQVWFYEP